MPSLTTGHMKPSSVLQFDRYFGTYDRAVAWIATEDYVAKGAVSPAGTLFPQQVVELAKQDVVSLIADLFATEPAIVAQDAAQARQREQKKPKRSVAQARTQGPGHPTGGRLTLHQEK